MSSASFADLVGHLGRDAEFVQKAEKSFVRFSVAVNQRSKDGQDEAAWYNVVAFRGAEFLSRALKKGSFVHVRGSLSQRRYTGKDGVAKTSIEVMADNVTLLGPKVAPIKEVHAEAVQDEHGEVPF